MLTMLRISEIKGSIRPVAVFAATVVAGTLFASLPVTIDGGSFDLNTALAVGNGNENSNGGIGQGSGQGDTNGGGNATANAGSLNAAHASTQGLTNANARSRPGALRAYMEAMVAYEEAYALVDWTAYDLIIGEIDTKNLEIEGLEGQIAALDPEDPDYETDKLDLEGQITTLEGEIATLQDDADALTADLDAAAADAAGSLEDAANKDGLIDPAVIDATNSLLDGKFGGFTHSTVVHDSEQDIADIVNPPAE